MNHNEAAASKALAGRLVDCVRAAVRTVGAVCTIVHLPGPEGEALHAIALGGTFPSIFAMPEKIPFEAPEPYAEAFRSGRTVTHGEPGAAPGDAGPKPVIYTITSLPLLAGGRPYGTLSVIRIPRRDGRLSETDLHRLASLADDLAGALASMAAQGVLEGAVPRQPLICPEFPLHDPQTPPAPWWALPVVPGAAGLSWMYQIHQLSRELNRAVSMHDVAAAARKRVMEPFGASTLMLIAQSEDRFWVIGHSGEVTAAIHQIHGSSAVQPGAAPLADVVRSNDPYLYPNRESLAQAYPEASTDGNASMAYLPMAVSGRAVGVCCLGWTDPCEFDAEAVAVMTMVANHLAQALERTHLVESEHALVEGFQRQLLPRRLPEVPGLAVTARYVPAVPTAGVGGDWYDVVPLPKARIAMIVGDVEGHGVESAALMGQLRSAVLASVLALNDRGPAAVLAHADELLHRLDTDLMATCCIVCLDTGSGVARVANAGHPAPLARDPDGRIRILDDLVRVPLGLPVPSAAGNEEFEIALEPGALLLLYSNGIADTSGPDAVTSAQGKLAAAVHSNEDTVDEVVDRLAQMTPTPLRDDVIILAAEYQGGDAKARPDIHRVEIQRHDLHGVGAARRVMEGCLKSWDLTSMTDTANLVLSELVTNALIHADSDVDIRVVRYKDHIRLEVLDYDVHPPIPSTLSMRSDEENARAENGRGLALVDALGMDWGTSRTVGGKTVWADIAPDLAE